MSKYGDGKCHHPDYDRNHSPSGKLEEKLASYFNTEDAVYLPSGYMSSLAGLKALQAMGKYERIFLDESAHYSLMEGAMATGIPVESTSGNGDLNEP